MKTTGFLQGFDEIEILYEQSWYELRNHGFKKAIEIAMLGMTEEANALLLFLHFRRMNLYQTSYYVGVNLFYHVTKLPSPFEPQDAEALQRHAIRDCSYGLVRSQNQGQMVFPDSVSASHLAELMQLATRLASQATGYVEEMMGQNARILSAALMASAYEAHELDRPADVEHLMMSMANRIHSNCQADYFAQLIVAWEKFFLPGGLRRHLEVQEHEVKEYAEFVLETLKRRLEQGPVSPHAIYVNKSLEELLGELERNTMKDSDHFYHYMGEVPETGVQTTIMNEPATAIQISQAEERLGRSFPEDMKEFYRITNGCKPVKIYQGVRRQRFLPLEDIFLEEHGMVGYALSLLPDFDSEVDIPRDLRMQLETKWLSVSDSIVAMYEDEGQNTEYTWIVPKAELDAARANLGRVREMADPKLQKKIDEAIVGRYGSKKICEDMEFCIFIQPWGQPEGRKMYPTFRHFLCDVVYQSRESSDTSPVKMATR